MNFGQDLNLFTGMTILLLRLTTLCAHENLTDLLLHLASLLRAIICVVSVSATVLQTSVTDACWHPSPGPTASSEVLLASMFHTQDEQGIHPAPEQLWGTAVLPGRILLCSNIESTCLESLMQLVNLTFLILETRIFKT